MTSSSEPTRTRVLRRGAGTAVDVRPARLTSDLYSSPYASAAGTDARLVDPVLERAVAEHARQAAEAGRAAGYAEGHAHGSAAAAAEAAEAQARQDELWAERTADADAELARALAVLHAAATELERRTTPVAAQVEALAMRLAVDLAEALVARELTATDDVVLATASRALALAPAGAAVVLHVNPADVAVLGGLDVAARPVEVRADPAVATGSCLVDAGVCTVDGRIDDALARVRAVLAG